MRRSSSVNQTARKSELSVSELDAMFISKLEEKFQLTDRGLQRAFKKFDSDGSGFLSRDELYKAVKLFLNGINEDLVFKLVHRYDTDGDGRISIQEFTTSILSRHSGSSILSPERLSSRMSTSHPTASVSDSELRYVEEKKRVEAQEIDNSNTLQYQVSSFLQNIKAFVLKQVSEMKLNKLIPLQDRLMTHSQQLNESIAKDIILAEFKPYYRKDKCVDYISFSRVINKFIYPGAIRPSDDVIKHLFTICTTSRMPESQHCDPSIFLDLIFSKTSAIVNQFGFTQPVVAATDRGRPEVLRGPIVKKTLEPTSIESIPLRMITKQSHTGLAAPTDFSVQSIIKSNQLPNISINKEYVIGINIKPFSGRIFYSLPFKEQTIVYFVGKLIVIHDLNSQEQQYLQGHDLDISCFTLSKDYRFLASGQIVSKRTCIIVWHDPFKPSVGHQMTRIGEGFFNRGVSCISFTHDNEYICGISNDDKHMLGIFHVGTGKIVTSISSASGIPPQITSMEFSSNFVNTSYISKEHGYCNCDLFVSAGPRHLKFWSFQRPSKSTSTGKFDPSQLLAVRSYSMGSVKTEAPKAFTCVAIYSLNPSNINIVVGGDNGVLYKFNQNSCIAALSVIPKSTAGGVCHVIVSSSLIYCCGGGGLISTIDAISFTQISCINICTPKNPTSGPSLVNNPVLGRSNLMSKVSSKSRPRSASTPTEVAGAPSIRPTSAIRGTKRIVTKDNIKSLGEFPKAVPNDGIANSSDVIGVDIVFDPRTGQTRGILALTNFGKLFYINSSLDSNSLQSKLSFHYGPLYALAVYRSRYGDMGTSLPIPSTSSDYFNSFFASGGDDRWLSVWSYQSRELVVRTKLKNAIRAIDFDGGVSNSDSISSATTCVVVGTTFGFIYLYTLSQVNEKFRDNKRRSVAENSKPSTKSGNYASNEYELTLVGSARDSMRDISDVKFNREGNMIAVGSHDDMIHIYSHKFQTATLSDNATSTLKYVRKLRGHSSYITHLDWSFDGTLLRSTCGAYELLFWDVLKGKQYLSSLDALEADTLWMTETCVLGFQVMGIWPKDSDGTDINSIDVSKHLGIVVTGDDSDRVNVLNYPSVIKHAPAISLTGHGSHVLNVKFASANGGAHDSILSAGGDGSLFIWSLR